MQQVVKFTEVWHIMWFFTATLIWYLTHTNTHRENTQGPVDWHTHINIDLHHLLFAHSSYLYYIEWIFHWFQKFTFHMSFLFKNYSLVKVICLLIRCYKTSFFLWNTNNTDESGVNKQNTHTHTPSFINGEGGGFELWK